jgi:broad specificity phosphatase PhoE
MTVKRVVFVRTGETEWNRLGRWQGWVAAPLNAHGQRQVQKLAKFVRHIAMSALYSSDLRRAKDTAAPIAEACNFEPIYDERLRERHIGDWQGLTLEEVSDWYAETYHACVIDPDQAPVPGGETRAQVRERMLAVFADILAQDKGETVGVVSHTTAIKALLTHLLPDADERGMVLDNSSVTTIVRDGDGTPWRVVMVGDGAHLEGLETKAVGELEYGP